MLRRGSTSLIFLLLLGTALAQERFRIFQLVSDRTMEEQVNAAARDGYKLVATVANSAAGLTLVMQRRNDRELPSSYRFLFPRGAVMGREQFRDWLNQGGAMGFRLRSDLSMHGALVMERAENASKSFEYDVFDPGWGPINVHRGNIARKAAAGFEPVLDSIGERQERAGNEPREFKQLTLRRINRKADDLSREFESMLPDRARLVQVGLAVPERWTFPHLMWTVIEQGKGVPREQWRLIAGDGIRDLNTKLAEATGDGYRLASGIVGEAEDIVKPKATRPSRYLAIATKDGVATQKRVLAVSARTAAELRSALEEIGEAEIPPQSGTMGIYVEVPRDSRAKVQQPASLMASDARKEGKVNSPEKTWHVEVLGLAASAPWMYAKVWTEGRDLQFDLAGTGMTIRGSQRVDSEHTRHRYRCGGVGIPNGGGTYGNGAGGLVLLALAVDLVASAFHCESHIASVVWDDGGVLREIEMQADGKKAGEFLDLVASPASINTNPAGNVDWNAVSAAIGKKPQLSFFWLDQQRKLGDVILESGSYYFAISGSKMYVFDQPVAATSTLRSVVNVVASEEKSEVFEAVAEGERIVAIRSPKGSWGVR